MKISEYQRKLRSRFQWFLQEKTSWGRDETMNTFGRACASVLAEPAGDLEAEGRQVRPQVQESLDRSLAEHGEAWQKLADAGAPPI
jgi:hypothetical protein